MNIIIATGIFPPDHGGPARYAKYIADTLKADGYGVRVYAYRLEKKLPIGIRHAWYFLRLLKSVFWADALVVLDTFSTGLPAMLFAKVFGKKTLVRIGGDQVWERFVERELVGLHEFYKKERALTVIEKIFRMGVGFVFRRADILAFTSRWQADIEKEAYGLKESQIEIVPNHFGPKKDSIPALEKRFAFHVRPVAFKNIEMVREAINRAQKVYPDITLDDRVLPNEEVLKSLSNCYAVLQPSISDIGPNFVLEGIEHNKPFIMTKHTGLKEYLDGVGVFIEPTVEELTHAIIDLCDKEVYAEAIKKVEQFTFTHSWEDIARKYIKLLEQK